MKLFALSTAYASHAIGKSRQHQEDKGIIYLEKILGTFA